MTNLNVSTWSLEPLVDVTNSGTVAGIGLLHSLEASRTVLGSYSAQTHTNFPVVSNLSATRQMPQSGHPSTTCLTFPSLVCGHSTSFNSSNFLLKVFDGIGASLCQNFPSRRSNLVIRFWRHQRYSSCRVVVPCTSPDVWIMSGSASGRRSSSTTVLRLSCNLGSFPEPSGVWRRWGLQDPSNCFDCSSGGLYPWKFVEDRAKYDKEESAKDEKAVEILGTRIEKCRDGEYDVAEEDSDKCAEW